MGCGSGMTCCSGDASKNGTRRGCGSGCAQDAFGPSRTGQRDRLGEGFFGLIQRSRPRGGQQTKNPTDKGKQGSKRHVVVDRNGVTLAVIHTAANVHDWKSWRRPRGRHRADPQAPRQTTQTPEETARREGLRLRSLCRKALRRKRGITAHRSSARHRVQREAGTALVGGGADTTVVDQPLWAAEGAL